MATLTYIRPFDHQPSAAEMHRHEHVILDVGFAVDEIVTVIHSLNLPRGVDPVVMITPTQRDTFVWCVGFGTNDVLIQSSSAGTARLTIARP